MDVHTADPRTTLEYLHIFGLSADDCPALGVFDRTGDIGPAGVHYILPGGLREANLATVNNFLADPARFGPSSSRLANGSEL
jgi:hypothetical protein